MCSWRCAIACGAVGCGDCEVGDLLRVGHHAVLLDLPEGVALVDVDAVDVTSRYSSEAPDGYADGVLVGVGDGVIVLGEEDADWTMRVVPVGEDLVEVVARTVDLISDGRLAPLVQVGLHDQFRVALVDDRDRRRPVARLHEDAHRLHGELARQHRGRRHLQGSREESGGKTGGSPSHCVGGGP